MNYFSLPNAFDAAYIRSLGPTTSTDMKPGQVLDLCLHWGSRKLWTGEDEDDQTSNGVSILRWLYTSGDSNHGLGPTISCGTLANAMVALLAGHGMYARHAVCVDDRGRPDHSIEVWHPVYKRWCHYIPQIGGVCFLDLVFPAGRPLSIQGWIGKRVSINRYRFFSKTGGWPVVPELDYFRDAYRTGKFGAIASVVNGNTVALTGDDTAAPVQMLQIRRDTTIDSEWNNGVNVPQSELYPDLGVIL